MQQVARLQPEAVSPLLEGLGLEARKHRAADTPPRVMTFAQSGGPKVGSFHQIPCKFNRKWVGMRAPGVINQWAAAGLTVEPKVLALVYERFLCHVPVWRGSKGSSTGCQGVLWDPRDPLS